MVWKQKPRGPVWLWRVGGRDQLESLMIYVLLLTEGLALDLGWVGPR